MKLLMLKLALPFLQKGFRFDVGDVINKLFRAPIRIIFYTGEESIVRILQHTNSTTSIEYLDKSEDDIWGTFGNRKKKDGHQQITYGEASPKLKR